GGYGVVGPNERHVAPWSLETINCCFPTAARRPSGSSTRRAASCEMVPIRATGVHVTPWSVLLTIPPARRTQYMAPSDLARRGGPAMSALNTCVQDAPPSVVR